MTLDEVTAHVSTVVVDADREQTPRWRPGERLPDVFAAVATARPDAPAVDDGERRRSFADVACAAHRLARHLLDAGVGAGDRVAILLDEPVDSYVAMLAVGTVHAAYVPLDAGFPADRVGFICDDAEVAAAVTVTGLADRLPDGPRRVLLDAEADTIDARDGAPLGEAETGAPTDDLAYLIYTSGTTGRPKGVAIEHAAIVNFVRVAAEVYGLHADDRVYQGMTIAFDFSVEELWVPWAAGATLVPKPAGATLLGDDLAAFLREREVTALCCVPTLLATLDETECEALRFVLVSGEACPQDLVARWHREDRRFLNVYGPTEATVTATWTALHPDRAVTLGRPLPTYAVVVLDPDNAEPRPVAPGEPGEIAVAGIGLARGYVNRPERTAAAFVEDTLGVPGNVSGQLYRTGDLGVVTADGEIAYHGRIDTQVKIRGYRVELTEIESVMLTEPGVAAAVVDTREPSPGTPELVGWFSLRSGADADATREAVRARLRDRLPGYMVPPFLEHLDVIPLTTSDKVDRANLPAPTGPRQVAAGAYTAPSTETERRLVTALAQGLGAASEEISTTAHLFDELGASSLLLARFTRAAREEGLVVGLRESYEHPTVADLASVLDARTPAVATGTPVVPPRPVHRASAAAMAATGVAQVLVAAAYLVGVALAVEWASDLVGSGDGVASLLLRAVAVGAIGFAVLALAPIVVKWVLVGRWRETEIPIWGLRYLRFWIVKTVVRANLAALLFLGTPVYSVYLRALGVKVGKRALVLTPRVPVCTDLVSIGADAVVRKDAWIQGYAAEGGMLRTGRVEVGEGAFVGESSVLEIDTRLGAAAQLGHSSCLAEGGWVPDGERWHGTPARPGPGTDYQRMGDVPLSVWRRFSAGLQQVLQILVLIVPITVLVLEEAVGLGVGDVLPPLGSPAFFGDAAVVSALTFFGVLALGLVAAVTLPRLLRRLVVPGETYPLYGSRYSVSRLIALLSNRKFAASLFGDSVVITWWQRMLGWDLGTVDQTGSNFGTTHKHDSPFTARVGGGTMVSDGLSMAGAEYSSTAFRVQPTEIGARNFLGNGVIYPAGGRTGDDVLLATKVAVPLEGEVVSGTGLLGSPAFRIPRSVQREGSGERPTEGAERAAALPAKTRHNAVSMLCLLLARWGETFVLTLLGFVAAAFYPAFGVATIGVAAALAPLVGVAWFVLAERAALGFRRLRPTSCSIYDRTFWRHERLWKLDTPPLAVLDGTPFKPVLLRLLGVRVGKRLYDDGARIPEHTMLTLGDHVTLGAGTTIQSHSLEDGAFTREPIELGDEVTLGTNSFVHYGVTMREGSVLDADAFLMKGNDVPAGTRWSGNPAEPAA